MKGTGTLVCHPHNTYICSRLSYNLHYSEQPGGGKTSSQFVYVLTTLSPLSTKILVLSLFSLNWNYSRMSLSQRLEETPLLSSWSSEQTARMRAAVPSCPHALPLPPSNCPRRMRLTPVLENGGQVEAAGGRGGD